MEYRPFGPTQIKLPVIGQGTWKMEHDDRKTAIATLRRGIDQGMNHIDTAELYGQGKVEEQIVREAIAGLREEVFLVSKVLPPNASRQGTIRACEQSLQRLGTDYLDCYLLHWPSPHPLEETVAALEELVAAGKTRFWGVSNFDETQMAELVQIAGADRITCNQVLYHLRERQIEHAVLPFCQQHGIAVVAYSPLGSGRFPSAQTPGGQVLFELANAHRATPYQIALAFLVAHPSLFAIPKAARTDHVLDNASAGDLHLTETELQRLDEAFPCADRYPGVPVL